MWTNGHEEFFVRVAETTFETRYVDIGAWPAPGERTADVLREGGATQVAANPEDLEAALGRCHQYLTGNLQLGADAFKPLGALLLAKLHDEAEPEDRRRVWVRGEEPFDADGQLAIRKRVDACFEDARATRPDVLFMDGIWATSTRPRRHASSPSLPATRWRRAFRRAASPRFGQAPAPPWTARRAAIQRH